MKPTFALNITDEGFVLLHRTAKGWTNVGETLYSAPDLPEAMAYLRNAALGLVPKGMSTKLVIPNSQILYTEVEAPGPSDSARRKQIAAALEGQTPYTAAELVFDWSGKGPKVQVVAVAKETLKEAEAFAVEHRLNPLSFVAIPEPGTFDGEPYFGPTAFSATHLKSGEGVERDLEPILPLSRSLPKVEAEPVAEAPFPSEAAPSAPAAAAKADTPPEVAAKPPAAAEPPMAATSEPAKTVRPDTGPIVPDSAPYAPLLETPANGIERALATQKTASERKLQDAEATAALIEPGKLAASLTPPGPQPVPEAPFAEVPEPLPAPEFDDIPDMPGAPPRGGLPDDIPPAPASSIRMAFASRRAGAETGAPPLSVPSSVAPAAATAVGRPSGGAIGVAPPLGAASPDADGDAGLSRIVRGKPVEDLPPLQRSGLSGQKAAPAPARSGVAKSFGAFVAPAGMSGAKKKAKVVGGPVSAPVAATPGSSTGAAARTLQPTKPLTKPGGTFGATPKRGKPRYLGLVLTALLLVFLGLVAAWSSFYLSADTEAAPEAAVAAGDAGPSIAAPEAIAPDLAEPEMASGAPAIEDEMLADGELDPEVAPLPEADAAPEAAVAEAAPASGEAGADGDLALSTSESAAPADAVADAVATEVATAAATEDAAAPTETAEPAPGTAIASDSPAAAALTEDQDEIFLAGMDTPPPALDALALPPPELSGDLPPGAQAPPPPFGTVYQFDDRGLIRPTPEGIMTPEGVMLFAGAPPLLPPARPQSVAEAAASAAAAQAVPAAADAALGSIAAPAEAEAVPAPSDPSMSGFRPRPRPEGIAPPSADDASAPIEPGTVVTSLRPRAKPQAVITASEAARLQSEAASLAAQADAQLATASNDPSNPSLLAISRRPAARPQDFSRAVDAAVQLAVAEAVREPEPEPAPAAEAAIAHPEDDQEPELTSAAPSAPLKGTVAKKATFVNALNLSKVNLIGVYGTDSRRYALIRQANGRFKKVRVGDRFDGGQVAAITASEVRYQKGGQLVSLKLPRG